MNQPMPRHATGRFAPSRQAWAVALLALVLYAVAVGVMRLFDWSVQAVRLEQLRQEGQLVPAACRDCPGLGAQVLGSIIDGRVLLVFAVLLGVAVAGSLVGRRISGPGDRADRERLAT